MRSQLKLVSPFDKSINVHRIGATRAVLQSTGLNERNSHNELTTTTTTHSLTASLYTTVYVCFTLCLCMGSVWITRFQTSRLRVCVYANPYE